MTWKRQVEESIKKVGLEKEDALDRAKWKARRSQIYRTRCEVHPATLVNGVKTGLKLEEEEDQIYCACHQAY